LHKTSGAIIVTASHNPYFYNGLKFKNSLGGSASPKQTKIFEEKIKQTKEVDLPEVDIHSQNPEIKTVNPKNEYFSHLEGLVDCELISSSNPKVIVDPMFGAGQGYYYQLLKRLGVNVLEIHNQIDPFFGGLQPEPIMPHLNELKQTVVSEGYDLGLALDGDADRSGIIDNQGNFINSHQIFSLLLWHLTENKGQKGSVIKTVSTTSLIDKIAATNTLPLVETPVGFKYISDHMINNDVLIGGEESGGIGARGHIPERDGIFIGLLVLEMLAITKKTIPELLAKLFQKYGNFVYDRKDLDISDNLRKTFYEQLNQLNAQDFFNKQIDQTKNKDGVKYLFNDGSWLMLRLSGTEAVVRVYSEADSKIKMELNTYLMMGAGSCYVYPAQRPLLESIQRLTQKVKLKNSLRRAKAW